MNGLRMAVAAWVVGTMVALVGGVAARAEDRGPATQESAGKVKIALAGDSTVAEGSGWGPGFTALVKDNVEVINLARGGRSSKSFIHEGLWKKTLATHADYVLIQFGHNDQPGHPPERQTDANTTYRQFMNQYVDEARAAGMKPVLVTSLSRRQWGEDGKIHSTLVPYVEVVKEIAAEKHVPLIDLHARSIELYERIGKAGCEELSPLKADKNDPAKQVYDGTHLNAKGSQVIGAIVAEELGKVVPELKGSLKSPAAAGE